MTVRRKALRMNHQQFSTSFEKVHSTANRANVFERVKILTGTSRRLRNADCEYVECWTAHLAIHLVTTVQCDKPKNYTNQKTDSYDKAVLWQRLGKETYT